MLSVECSLVKCYKIK